jgi:hypothetical protein
MGSSTFWLLVKALLALVPWLVQEIREGNIKDATLDEVQAALAERWKIRVEAAANARAGLGSSGVLPDLSDPNDRASRRTN